MFITIDGLFLCEAWNLIQIQLFLQVFVNLGKKFFLFFLLPFFFFKKQKSQFLFFHDFFLLLFFGISFR